MTTMTPMATVTAPPPMTRRESALVTVADYHRQLRRLAIRHAGTNRARVITAQSRALEELGRCSAYPTTTISPDAVVYIEAVLADLEHAIDDPAVAANYRRRAQLEAVARSVALLLVDVDPRPHPLSYAPEVG